ncbi:nucleophile aminohydrolase [Diplogelasinospora grovesii]|uniref:Nucleophile aminohydrolase n=1 Tax=Diplogelasinospora grovesii TaxID=303347 RepID=A0AAN6NID5_9PEZI|nr:nucleophile aminohydrolase [Diplogelasinospora grovesii]
MSSEYRRSSVAIGGDGAVERIWKRGKQPVAAVFIHAGAGYHSLANERVHLEACSEAARVGMRFLRAGAPAPEAVEAAIKCLEDTEITNAGFGSNLNMDGVVECDATIVDHLGRSGACGAVPGIKNPISLAKIILDKSSQPLSLRRVPPNILVGLGAKQFAEEHGMAGTPNEYLVSKNAKDRYIRWSEDLRKAEGRPAGTVSPPCKYPEFEPRSPTPSAYEKAAHLASPTQRRDHASAILTGVWNEGQPDSPYPGGSPAAESAPPIAITPATARTPHGGLARSPPSSGKAAADRHALASVSAAFQSRLSSSPPERPRPRKSASDDPGSLSSVSSADKTAPPSPASPTDGSISFEDLTTADHYQSIGFDAANDAAEKETSSTEAGDGMEPADEQEDMDLVTDTVGAIAIDMRGNIAAGSSSGGIGMKHRGRIGPAALVGIGTAVVPQHPDDEEGLSVAAVTSGTGEHMATSLASAKCADRLFHGTRQGPGGRSIEEPDEHNVMESFVLDDFMGHPGVKNQTSTGAIGVMAVKKNRNGIYFFFAHNTDSFALASMASHEREPNCVMSRLAEAHPVAQGGRKIRID